MEELRPDEQVLLRYDWFRERHERDWSNDSRTLTPKDAEQVVKACREAYSEKRFRWLMAMGEEHGITAAIRGVFAANK